MNLQQLRYFVTTAQLENISKAADVFHLSQSSLSKNILKLEEEIGMPLFVRNGKRISLNPAGARFLDSCMVILREMEQAVSDMRMMTSGENPTIKIGFAGKIKDLVRYMTRFRELYPTLQYELNSDIENIDHLDINDFDVLIYPDEPRYARFSGYRIGEETYFFAVSADSPLSRSAVASPELMKNRDFVFLKRGEKHIEFPYRICTSLAIPMNSQNFADSRGAHRRFISTNMAVGFVPEGEAQAYTLDKKIRLLPILDKRFARPMMICFKREKRLSDKALEFRDFLIREMHLPADRQNGARSAVE